MAGPCGWALWLGSVAGPCPPLVRLLAAPLNSVNSVAVAGPCPLVLLLAAPLNSVNSVAGPCPPLVLLLAAPLNSVNSVAGLCGWALWLFSVAGRCHPLVLLLPAPLNSVNPVAGLCGWVCGWALSSSCPTLGHAPQLCQLCGWALWLGFVAGPCPPLVLLLAAPRNFVNSALRLFSVPLSSSCPPLGRLWLGCVAGLCVQALSSSCPP